MRQRVSQQIGLLLSAPLLAACHTTAPSTFVSIKSFPGLDGDMLSPAYHLAIDPAGTVRIVTQ